MTAQFLPVPIYRGYDNNGVPLAGGQLWTYAAGTNFPQNTWTDSTQGQLNTNPVFLNFRGECQLWLDPALSYKLLLLDSLGNTIPGYPVDNVKTGFSILTGTFTLTGTGFGGVAPSVLVTYIYIPGYSATISVPFLSGTSNATSFTATGLPAFLQPANIPLQTFPLVSGDNNIVIANGTMNLTAASGTLSFLKGGSLTGWTAANSKNMTGTFTYLLL